MKFIDVIGQKYGELTVIRQLTQKDKYNHILWECECSCGRKRIVRVAQLRNGTVTRCTKCSEEHRRQLLQEIDHPGKHNLTGTRLYNIWRDMKQRCTDPKCNGYKNYGGRDITYCKEWEEFTVFMEWAYDNGYSDNVTLDRIDNNKNYCPENCKWSTVIEQASNKRTNHYLTFNNETHTISEWSRITGINKNTIQSRIQRYGWSTEDTLTKEPQERKK